MPVSSEAVNTLVMTQFYGSGALDAVNTSIWLHLGTMLASVVYFRSEFAEMVGYAPEYLERAADGDLFGEPSQSFISFIALATALTAGVGGVLYLGGIEKVAAYPRVFTALTGVALLLTGVLRYYDTAAERYMEDVDTGDSVLVGMLQALSVVPGVSRSGSTVFGLFLRDYDAEDAFRISFMLSVPAVLAANIGLGLLGGVQVTGPLLFSTLVAFAAGYASIDVVLRVADRAEVSYICFALAALAFLAALL